MTKFMVRFLLSLFILLAGGYSQLNACHKQGETAFISAKRTSAGSHNGIGTLHHAINIFPGTSSANGNENKIEAEENISEEDESPSSKKYFEISHYFTSLFNANHHGYFLHYLNKRLPVDKHFSQLSSDWSLQIIFGIFRL